MKKGNYEGILSSAKPVLIEGKVLNEKFNIFHTKKAGDEDLSAERFFVGTVEAFSIEDAFVMAQNDFNSKYRKLGVRSTCVGDLIQNKDGFYLVKKMGFEFICPLSSEGAE